MPRGNPKREWMIQVRCGEWFISRAFYHGVTFQWGPYTRKEAEVMAREYITSEFLRNEHRYYLLSLMWEFSIPCWQAAENVRELYGYICTCYAMQNPACRMYHPTIPPDLVL